MNDPLNTTRLARAVEALEDYVQNIAAPLAGDGAEAELKKLRQENETLRKKQADALTRLDGLIQTIEQKGLK
jgi:hypothetical protein